MLSQFEKKVTAFIKENGLFDSVDRVLLAVSGGADSLALMHAMYALKGKGIFNAELLCAHINHQLRQREADLDEDFVVAQAAKLRLPAITGRIDVQGFARNHKLSIETAARKLRIDRLLGIARANKCGSIATGHQKNDNAETVLQRVARGTGFRGLGGIWVERVFEDKAKFVRPLLCVTREEILNYLEKRNLSWRIDRTNADCMYRRNYIRHRLLPALQQDCSGSIVEQLSRLAQSARRLHNVVCRRADEVWPELAGSTDGRLVLKLATFQPEHPAVKIELIRRSLAAIGSGEKNLTQHHYGRILQLAAQPVSSKKIELPGRFVVECQYERLFFSRPKKELLAEAQICEISKVEIPGRTEFGRYIMEAYIFEVEKAKSEAFKAKKGGLVEWFDLNELKLPLVVRLRQVGDRFWPLGLSGPKRVGKFLTDAKVPQEIRRTVLIVADREKIIWVWPIRISEQAKVTNKTGKILQLQIVV
jgi:tRNA(Ile)-lysidine synthase